MLDTAQPKVTRLLDDYFSEDEYCAEVDVTPRAARAQRAAGTAPPYVKLHGKIYYSRSGFREWLKAIEKRPVRTRKVA